MQTGKIKPDYEKAPQKRKVGVMLVSSQPQKFMDSKILRCNDPNEPAICWYAMPTVTQLLDFQANQRMDPAILRRFVHEEQPDDFQPTWSKYRWKNHFTARDYLIAKGMGDFGVVCVGYKERKSTGVDFYDAQIGLTGTVETGESFWEAGVRETFEECNIKIESSQCLNYFQEMRNGEVRQEVFVVVIG